jgi:hypothetical protein
MEASDAGKPRSQRSELTGEMLRYWEPRRIIYNAVLALVAGAHLVSHFSRPVKRLNIEVVLVVFVLAIGANILYCAAYVVDWFVQQSEFRDPWRRARWIMLAIGTALAAVFTHYLSGAIFPALPDPS